MTHTHILYTVRVAIRYFRAAIYIGHAKRKACARASGVLVFLFYNYILPADLYNYAYRCTVGCIPPFGVSLTFSGMW